jgi:hypothetical protein
MEGERLLLRPRRRWEVNIKRHILVYKPQLDAQVTEFILSGNCSTCFGRHHHPSSGAQNKLKGI